MASAGSEYSGSDLNRGPAVFAVTMATLLLATVFVASRMVSRYFIVKNVGWDDKVIQLAWLISFFLSFTICYGVSNGLGQHDDDIPARHLPILRRCEYVFSVLYNPALMATKTSILIFYLRLAKNTQTVLRIASWITLAIVNIAGVVLTLMNIFQCKAIEAAWNSPFGGRTTCIPLLTEFICAAPVNVVTDLAVLALPIPVLTSMRLPSRQKTILILTFALGIFVTIVDVIRIYYLQQALVDDPTGLTSDHKWRFGGQADFAYNASFALMWSAVEVNIGMACACIPTLKPLVLRLLPSMLYDPNGTRSSSSSSSRSSRSRSSRDSRDSRDSHACKGHPDFETPLSSAGAPSVTRPEPVACIPQLDASESADAPMGVLDFLTTSNMHPLGERFQPVDPVAARARTSATLSTDCSYVNGVYFGFVNMTKPKSMLRANAAESFKYCTIVSILFLLWGISYGLLNSLNNAVADVNQMTTAQTIGLTSAYFGGGYFFGPLLVGEWILRRDEHSRSRRHRKNVYDNIGGYKATFITGLVIYGTGTIIFWPSAVTCSFGGFMLSNFVVGFGLSVLEVAANSFMVLCGPPQYAEVRLLVAQGVQATGSVLSGLLAQKVFFKSLSNAGWANAMSLSNLQWTYLSITLLCVALGLFFYYMPLPEVSDDELEQSTRLLAVDPRKRSIGGLQLRTLSLVLAVLAQYMYVGGQESNSTFFRSLLVSVIPGQPNSGRVAASGTLMPANAANPDQPPGLSVPIPDYLTVGHTAFAVGRFVAGYFAYASVRNPRMPKPRIILGVSIFLCFVFALVSVAYHPSNPNLLLIPVCLFFFAEGPIWPLLYSIGLRGQGRRTKRAAAFITMGASGPAFIPFIMYGIMTHGGGTVQVAFIVIVALQFMMMAYPAFLVFVEDAGVMVDPDGGTRNASSGEGGRPMDEVLADTRRSDDTASVDDAGNAPGILEKVSREFGAKLFGARRKSIAEVEHKEDNARGQIRS